MTATRYSCAAPFYARNLEAFSHPSRRVCGRCGEHVPILGFLLGEVAAGRSGGWANVILEPVGAEI